VAIQSIQIITLNEHSAAVANLQAALQALGLTVSATEVQNDTAGATTLAAIREFQKLNNIPFDAGLLVDSQTALIMNRLLMDKGLLSGSQPASNKLIVNGTVVGADGLPAIGVTITAYDQDLRSRQQLGDPTTTDAQGAYTITYLPAQYATAEIRTADLMIEVTWPPKNSQANDVMFNVAGPTTTVPPIQLKGYYAASQYSQVNAVVQRLIDQQKDSRQQPLTPAGLEQDGTNNDVTFISGESSLSAGWVSDYIVANKLAGSTSLNPQFWFALLRQGALAGASANSSKFSSLAAEATADAAAAISVTVAAATKAVNDAIAGGVIDPLVDPKTIDAWASAFSTYRVDAAKGTSSPAGGAAVAPARPELVAILSTFNNKVSAQNQATFTQIYLDNNSRSGPILSALTRDFTSAEVDSITTALTLSDLTLGHPPLITSLAQIVTTTASIMTLARMGVADWQTTLNALGSTPTPTFIAGATPAAKVQNYATLLTNRFAQLYPTASFAGGLQRASAASPKQAAFAGVADILTFLNAHSDFEFNTTNIDTYIANKANAGTFNLPNRATFTQQLKAVQRVFKVAPTYDQSSTLLADGIHTARQIYQMGQTQFVNRYSTKAGFTAVAALDTYNRAANTHAASLTIVGQLRATQNAAAISVLAPFRPPISLAPVQAMTGGSSTSAPDPIASNFPNLQTLFGGGDYCACDECTSDYGPAAYFVDLLQFLDGRQSLIPQGADLTNPQPPAIPPPPGTAMYSVRDIFLSRRGDVANLEFICDNAMLPLKYIDLICEITEDHIAPWVAFTLPASIGALAQGPLPAAQMTAINQAMNTAATGSSPNSPAFTALTGDAVISDQDNTGAWILRDDNETYRITSLSAGGYTASILRQTRGTADELAAAPRYVNIAAYNVLAASTTVFPMNLPFDLPVEEARGYLKQVGITRADFLQKLRVINPAKATKLYDIAAEYFAISPPEQAPILTVNTNNGYTLWGQPDYSAASIKFLSEVDNFLVCGNIEFNDLLTMLTLDFSNPNNNLSIVDSSGSGGGGSGTPTATCNLADMNIQTLDKGPLDLFNRFIRLWRKLSVAPFNWQMWEINLLIANQGIGNKATDFSPTGSNFLVNLYWFAKVKEKFSTLSVEQLATFYDLISTKGKFVEKFKPFTPSLYESLFLNPKRIKPLSPDFAIATITTGIANGLATHIPAILAATRLKQADLDEILAITDWKTGAPITGDLNLYNLSFIYRHALMAQQLRLSGTDWTHLIMDVAPQNPFSDPSTTYKFIECVQAVFAAGFTVDDLRYLLAADITSKAAPRTKTVATFLTTLRTQLQQILAANDPSTIPSDAVSLAAFLTGQLQKLGWSAADIATTLSVLQDNFQWTAPWTATGTPPNLAVYPVTYTPPPSSSPPGTPGALTLTGWMTSAQQTALLALNSDPAYKTAINNLYNDPRLQIQFYSPDFSAPLNTLPTKVNFAQLKPNAVASKISYDPTLLQLDFTGIMSADDFAKLSGLVSNPPATPAEQAYINALNQIYTQATTIVPTTSPYWLKDTDISFDPTNVVANLTKAASRLAAYLATTSSNTLVTTNFSAALGVSTTITNLLLNNFLAASGQTFLVQFAGQIDTTTDTVNSPFAVGLSAFDFTADPTYFIPYYWLDRVVVIIKTLKITSVELQGLITLYDPQNSWYYSQTQILDFKTLPQIPATPGPTTPPASLTNLMNLAMFIAYDHQWVDDTPAPGTADPGEPALSVLTVVSNMLTQQAGYTAADFAADVETLTGWSSDDISSLLDPNTGIDLTFFPSPPPTGSPPFTQDYTKASGWRRLSDAFTILKAINASAATVLGVSTGTPLSTADATPTQTQVLKQAIQSKFEIDDWNTLSTTVQDQLRERKRDSLVAYLLAQKPPINIPGTLWNSPDNVSDMFLVDVEIEHCQLTSRFVQASGAIQLFVQRCFMGVESATVRVSVDQDSAWAQWDNMNFYRDWQIGRLNFHYPENSFDPQLRDNKSSFFSDFENELMQNDITEDNVEFAYRHYLEKLVDVAQLEIAGTWFEDDTNTFNVFARTPAGDPRIYYWRQWVKDQSWTPWEQVNLDIKADVLVPVVYNRRPYLIWPEYREKNVETSTTIGVNATTSSQTFTPAPAQKYSEIHLAISEYRNGQWSKKQISDDWAQTCIYTSSELDTSLYQLAAIDFRRLGTDLPGIAANLGIDSSKLNFDLGGWWNNLGEFFWFELLGCKGYPQLTSDELTHDFQVTHFYDDEVDYMVNTDKGKNFPLCMTVNSPYGYTLILDSTPTGFAVKYPNYLSFFDSALCLAATAVHNVFPDAVGLGYFYPWFFADKNRTFFVRPELMASAPPPTQVIEVLVRGGGTTPAPQKCSADITRLFYADLVEIFKDLIEYAELGQLGAAEMAKLQAFYGSQWQFQFQFKNFYHPFACLFTTTLYQNDLDGLLSRNIQLSTTKFQFNSTPNGFYQTYEPTPVVDPCYPKENVDFSLDGAYSIYNWELFFFMPLTIAKQLITNKQYLPAQQWIQRIFDYTGSHDVAPDGSTIPVPQKFWITKPFYRLTNQDYQQEQISSILTMLAQNVGNPSPTPTVQNLINQVIAWRQNPFDPNIVCQYRIVAYQIATVMTYLDCLLAWGDDLFTQDTMETVMEAAGIYIRASEILGPRPQVVPPNAKPPPATYNELAGQFDSFSDALVNFENLIPVVPADGPDTVPDSTPQLPMLYFCIPQNDKLLSYWKKVEDRLTKIRNCENIEGVYQQLALFSPPIDPGALVRALADGEDLASAISDLEGPLPNYRFTVMIQKANELAGDLKSLGTALLSALEKRDAEDVALLRQTQEIALLNAVRAVKQRQIDDAQAVLDGLNAYQTLVEFRQNYYQTRPFMNDGETAAANLSGQALVLQTSAQTAELIASVLAIIPDFNMGLEGFGGSPAVTTSIGGSLLSKAAEVGAKALSSTAGIMDKTASIASVLAGYNRRQDDWTFQASSAGLELAQVAQQIQSAQIKLDIANKELANHDLQIDNANAMNDFLHNKYTNRDLYNWMVGQISQSFFQSYQLAYDLAKRAQRCYEFELGIEDATFIQPGYWDNLRSGLLSGEQLQLALRRLEADYLDKNRREFELTKHVSLALLRPDVLIQIKTAGICPSFDLPEEIFDLDYTGHYFRRIKSVSISIPCVAGPQTTVSCTLRLLKSSIRINSDVTDINDYPRQDDDNGDPDSRFRDSRVVVSSISTSSAQNDSGMFELNFRDERYLPFEGAGAISTWNIELVQNPDFRQFDYESISDVVLHIRYTAREDPGDLKAAATNNLDSVLRNSGDYTFTRLFDLKHEFPTDWYAFLNPPAGGSQQMQIPITQDRFPFFAQQPKTITFTAVTMWILGNATSAPTGINVTLRSPAGDDTTLNLTPQTTPNNSFTAEPQDVSESPATAGNPWMLSISINGVSALTNADLQQCYMVIAYTAG